MDLRGLWSKAFCRQRLRNACLKLNMGFAIPWQAGAAFERDWTGELKLKKPFRERSDYMATSASSGAAELACAAPIELELGGQ